MPNVVRNQDPNGERRPTAITGRISHRRAMGFALLLVGLLMTGVVACSNEPVSSPTPTVFGGVTVPDNISALDPVEVDRRLERLFAAEGNSGGSAAPDVAPTETVQDPTLDDILDALGLAKPSAEHGIVMITVSESTLSGLANPQLAIKTQPAFGSATVISDSQILYSPTELAPDGDSFEYELFDGDRSIIAMTVEIK